MNDDKQIGSIYAVDYNKNFPIFTVELPQIVGIIVSYGTYQHTVTVTDYS